MVYIGWDGWVKPIRFEEGVVFVVFEFGEFVQVEVFETVGFGFFDGLLEGFFELVVWVGGFGREDSLFSQCIVPGRLGFVDCMGRGWERPFCVLVVHCRRSGCQVWAGVSFQGEIPNLSR